MNDRLSPGIHRSRHLRRICCVFETRCCLSSLEDRTGDVNRHYLRICPTPPLGGRRQICTRIRLSKNLSPRASEAASGSHSRVGPAGPFNPGAQQVYCESRRCKEARAGNIRLFCPVPTGSCHRQTPLTPFRLGSPPSWLKPLRRGSLHSPAANEDWSRPGSNRQPPGCKPGALPLSYGPEKAISS